MLKSPEAGLGLKGEEGLLARFQMDTKHEEVNSTEAAWVSDT